MMNNIQEQEHLDFVIGSATEHQNCFAQSAIEHNHANAETRGYIAGVVAAGKFVVVGEYPAHCRVTDAVVGVHTCVEMVCDTRDQAEAFLATCNPEPDYDMHIEPAPPVPEAPEPVDTEDVPF